MLKQFIAKFASKGCTKEKTGVCNCNIKASEGMANHKSGATKEKISGVAKKSV